MTEGGSHSPDGHSIPSIDVREAHRRLTVDPGPFVLDVREPWEFAEGHLPGARLVPLGELDLRLSEIPHDRPILSVCHVGQRSLVAAAYLLQSGYSDVTSMEGGTAAWIESGLPVER